MLNTKTYALKKQQKKEVSPRIPLKVKDLNISYEAPITTPTGCFSFLLSNHSFNKPHFKDFRGKLVKKGKYLANPDCFTAAKVKSDDVISSRFDLSDGVNKFASGFQFKVCDFPANVVKVGNNSEKCDLYDGFSELNDLEILSGESRNVDVNLRRCSLRGAISDGLSNGFEGFTAVDEFRSGCGYKNCEYDGKSTTAPPVEALVSPEIRGGLTSVVPTTATPTACYAADVCNKRKCRSEGLLASGSKMKGFRNEGEGVGGVGVVNSCRDEFVSSPIEASKCWNSSSCDGKMSENGSSDELRLNLCEKLGSFELIRMSSSPTSSLGFSSELFDTSRISISDASTSTPNSRKGKSYVLHSDLSSEFRGALGSSLDHSARSPASSSLAGKPTCNDLERLCIPKTLNLENCLGSGNVMQTPDSNSSRCDFRSSHSPKVSSTSPHFSLSELSRDQISRLWLECELDSLTEVVRRVSLSPNYQKAELDSRRECFEFNPLIKLDNSINLTLFQKAVDMRSPNSLEARISWREGLANRMFEMGELNCCRYLSDEDDNSDWCSDTSESCSCPKIADRSPSFEGPKLCRKFIDKGGKDTPGPEESSWAVCYKNNLFQV